MKININNQIYSISFGKNAGKILIEFTSPNELTFQEVLQAFDPTAHPTFTLLSDDTEEPREILTNYGIISLTKYENIAIEVKCQEIDPNKLNEDIAGLQSRLAAAEARAEEAEAAIIELADLVAGGNE